MTYARFAAVLWQQEVETVEMEMVAFGAEDCVELLFCHSMHYSGIVKRIDKELDRHWHW